MGRQAQIPAPPPLGLPPAPPATDSATSQWLEKIYNQLREEFEEGRVQGLIRIFNLTTGGTWERIFSTPTLVKKAIIQNISTENVTIITNSTGGVAGQGIILTKAGVSGEGGGSLPVSNVDLSVFYVVRTTAGATLAIYYERGAP